MFVRYKYAGKKSPVVLVQGTFILELPMGILSAYVLPEDISGEKHLLELMGFGQLYELN